MTRTYVALAETTIGEIGHNGWELTLNWSAGQQAAYGNFNVPCDHQLDVVTGYVTVEGRLVAVRLLAPFGGKAIPELDHLAVADIEARGRAHRAACDAACGYDPATVVVRGTGHGPGEDIDSAEWTWR